MQDFSHITTRIDRVDIAAIKKIARAEDRTFSWVLRVLLRESLAARKKLESRRKNRSQARRNT